jgi:polar amino acid transport system substrate-binding protein
MKFGTALAMLAALAAPVAFSQTIRVVTETSSTTKVVDGEVRGPAAEIARATLREAGLTDFHIDIYPWARAYELALREPNTMIYPLARTPGREKLFKWPCEVVKIRYYLYKLAERKDIVIGQLSDARPYTIGVERGDVRQQYLEEQGFHHLFRSSKWNENIAHVLNRQIDMVALADFNLDPLCAQMGLDCKRLEKAYALDGLSTSLYMAFSLGTDDAVVQRTKSAFERLKADGKFDRPNLLQQ